MKYFDQLEFEELWVHTLREIDMLYDEAQRNDAELSATDLICISASISALRRVGPLSDASAKEIGRLEEFFDNAMARETLGYRNVFDGRDDPERGAIGQVQTVRVLSIEGDAVDALVRRYRKILAMRDLLIARVDAKLQIAEIADVAGTKVAGEHTDSWRPRTAR